MVKEAYEERLRAWEKGRFSPPPDPDPTPEKPTLIERASMRDGVGLYTEIFLPDGAGPFPAILHRSPYPMARPSHDDRDRVWRYLQAGYGFVFQLTRGQGGSEGVFRWHLDDVNDGFDCVQWVADQSWCNGLVGMEGSSYAGCTQMLAARSRPDALRCIIPAAFIDNFTTCFPFTGGIPARGMLMQWYAVADAPTWEDLDAPYGDMSLIKHRKWGPALRKRPLIEAADGVLPADKRASWRDVISHPRDDAYWAPVHFTDEDLDALELPTLFTGGWYDPSVGPVNTFERLERLQPGRPDRYLLVGPWDHAQTYRSHLHHLPHGEREMPSNGAVDLIAQRIAFFDRYLKNDRSRSVQTDRVRMYISGANVWRNFRTFPPPGTVERTLYLTSEGNAHAYPGDGMLGWDPPGNEPTDHYVYDPTVPTPCEDKPFCDRRHIDVRADVLAYTSAPFAEPFTVLGQVTLTLHAASSAPDTDWFAVLSEVLPDGRAIPFHYFPGALRARYHQGFDREMLLTPHEPTVFRIPVCKVGHQIAAGHRLRLSVFSANFPFHDLNTNTGHLVATDVDQCVAEQTVYHDIHRQSFLTLPIFDLKN